MPKYLQTVFLPRGEGKTTALIKEAHKMGGVMVVVSRQMVDTCLIKARDMGLEILPPITFDDFTDGLEGRVYKERKFLFDDADLYLKMLVEKKGNNRMHAISITM